LCSRTYGTLPCTAALSALTPNKCYNSRLTCQDPVNYSAGVQTLRFARPQEGLLQYGYVIPSLIDVQTTPAAINLSSMDTNQQSLGQREVVTIQLGDHLHSDLFVDKYRLERATGAASFTSITFNPYQRGTFWGKWLARNPFYTFYRARIREGVIGQALGSMRVRNYVITTVAVDDDGQVTITLKDLFSLIEARKSVAPKASTGRLNADITNVAGSLTLTPAGIGDLEYPTSGKVCVGNEAMAFTRTGGSDVLTLTTRGDLNTAPSAHKQEDNVQLVLSFSAQLCHDIVFSLFTNYTDVKPADIVKADWDAAAVNLTRLYSANIVKPTPVQDLVGELGLQAGFSIWPDVESGLITFVALQSTAPEATVTDNEWIVDGSLRTKRQDQKRLSQVWVYYGLIDPTKSLTDNANYHSRAVVADLVSEDDTEYGTPSIREVFSRWIPQNGRTFALETGGRLLTMFRDPPMLANFRLHVDRSPQIGLARLFVLRTDRVLTDVGLPDSVSHIAIKVELGEAEIEVESQQVKFFTANPDVPGSTTRTIYIDNDSVNLNLRTIHDTLYAPPTGVETVVFVVSAAVKVGSVSTALYAIETGSWPAGVSLSMVNLGRVQGKGGRGGDGACDDSGYGGALSNDAQNGEPGGNALHVTYAISIDNLSGQLWGGGGGGGGGTVGDAFDAGGGGGGSGAGYTTTGGGLGRDGGFTNVVPGGNGGDGITDAGGAGGAEVSSPFGTPDGHGGLGGGGGGPGLAGSAGSLGFAGTGSLPLRAGPGTGAAAGNYVVGNALVTWVNNGDRRGGVVA
jgi:hypothetical protein